MRMGIFIPVALVILVSVSIGVYYYTSNRNRPQNAAITCGDPDSIESHIYNPDRLVVYKNCVTVSGIVDRVIVENDGDYHIRLRLDPPYRNLTNNVNNEQQYGDLVLEIVCANTVYQQDAIDACQNYTSHVTVPQENHHIVATGPYVLDIDHGWTEIHPVFSLTIVA